MQSSVSATIACLGICWWRGAVSSPATKKGAPERDEEVACSPEACRSARAYCSIAVLPSSELRRGPRALVEWKRQTDSPAPARLPTADSYLSHLVLGALKPAANRGFLRRATRLLHFLQSNTPARVDRKGGLVFLDRLCSDRVDPLRPLAVVCDRRPRPAFRVR